MKKIPPFILFVLLFCSFPLAYLFSLLKQAHSYTIVNHSFQFKFFPFLTTAVIAFFVLWIALLFCSKFFAWLFEISSVRTRNMGILSYIPLFFLLLLPLANSRYMDHEDFSARVALFGYAVLAGIFFIKFMIFLHLKTGNPDRLQYFWEKISSISLKKKLVALFILALVISNLGSVLMKKGGISYSGDEPHYLLITHSLLKDGDFNVANNYADEDYSAFMPEGVKLDVHIAPGSKGHSFHSSGLSILLLPFYAVGLLFSKGAVFFFVRFGMSIFGALLGIQLFLFAFQEWKNEKIALILWIIFCFSVPIFFYSLHLYPEIILALFSLTIFRLLQFTEFWTKSKLLLIGFLLGSFLWLHAVKYMFILIPFFLYAMWTLLKKQKVGSNIVYFMAGPIFLVLLHTLFSYTAYGSLSPFSVSLKGTTTSTESLSLLKEIFSEGSMKIRLETLLGYFFDQRDGLLLYAPVYFFGFLGMIELGRKNLKKLLTILFLTAPYVLGLAFLTQRGAYAPQARTQVAVFWAMGIFVGYFLVYNGRKIFTFMYSAALFFSYMVVFILLKNPWALYQSTTSGETQRAGELFLHMSNLHFYLPQFLPSFLKIENRGWIPNLIWILAFVLFIAASMIIKKHSFETKLSVHVTFVCLALIIVFFWGVLFPQFILQSPTNVTLPTGEKLTFYSLGRVIRMPSPGHFQLPRDNRSYVLYFSSWNPVEPFSINFGSLDGVFDTDIQYFDQTLFRGQISNEMKTVPVSTAEYYLYKKRYLYRLSIELHRTSGVIAYTNPFLFSLE
ncbi:MAG: hypothetical protein MUP98_06365 [Candidatus Aminicenantes bacterium]|nr:hypothetical protein [Candidatus Aminicenantes bacterium]